MESCRKCTYLSKEKFTELFPHGVYDSTDLKKYWKKGKFVFSEKEKNY